VKAPRLLAAALALGASTGPAGPAAAAERMIFTGSDEAVWLVRYGEDADRFDLAIRKLDGNWRRSGSGLSGRPAGAVAAGRQLHVLFASPLAQVVFEQDSGRQSAARNPDEPHWPAEMAPAALCEAIGVGDAAGRSLIAAVVRPAGRTTSKPASSGPADGVTTGPTSARRPDHKAVPVLTTAPHRQADGAKGPTLGLFQRIGVRWVHVADWPGAPIDRRTRVFVAAAGGAVYVVISSARGGNHVARWKGQWAVVPLTGPPATEAVIGMLTVRDQPIVLLEQSDNDPARRRLSIVTLQAERGTYESLLVVRDGRPATWLADRMPRAARLGDQIALLWAEDDTLRFATCVPQIGRLTLLGDVGVFDRPALDNAGQPVLTYFMFLVLGGTIVPMLVRWRRTTRPRPFSLPKNVRPAPRIKRILAGIVDLAPIYLLVSFGYALLPSALSPEQVVELFEQMVDRQEINIPLQVAVACICLLGTYVTYCTVTEAKYGATFGKRLMKLRVVAADADAPDVGQCLIRNVTKILELFLLGLGVILLFLVLFLPLLTGFRQRMGDVFAGTAVVDAQKWPPEPLAAESDADDADGSGPPAGRDDGDEPRF